MVTTKNTAPSPDMATIDFNDLDVSKVDLEHMILKINDFIKNYSGTIPAYSIEEQIKSAELSDFECVQKIYEQISYLD